MTYKVSVAPGEPPLLLGRDDVLDFLGQYGRAEVTRAGWVFLNHPGGEPFPYLTLVPRGFDDYDGNYVSLRSGPKDGESRWWDFDLAAALEAFLSLTRKEVEPCPS